MCKDCNWKSDEFEDWMFEFPPEPEEPPPFVPYPYQVEE